MGQLPSRMFHPDHKTRLPTDFTDTYATLSVCPRAKTSVLTEPLSTNQMNLEPDSGPPRASDECLPGAPD